MESASLPNKEMLGMLIADLAIECPLLSDFDFVSSIKDGSLSAKEFFEIVLGITDWKSYERDAAEDYKLITEISAEFKEKFPDIPTMPTLYECMECHYVSKRADFLQDQEELDEDGIPKVRLQCPDCQNYNIKKEKE
jgi:hypothetical protein